MARNRRQNGRRARGGVKSEINIAPLVDVMLVLLIVFMVSAPLLSVGVPVELPKTDAKSLPSQQEPITVTVDRDGNIFLGDSNEITLEELTPRLTAIAANGYEERIYIRGDGASDYANVMKVMARINAAGYSNIGLVTDPTTTN